MSPAGGGRAETVTVALLYPGAMGAAVAARLTAAGKRVLSPLEGRSGRTRERAEAAGVSAAASPAEALSQADLVLSLVPPGAALETARHVATALADAEHRPLYVDANSISPATVARVADELRAAGIETVDGAFLGRDADLDTLTRLYLSGDRAAEAAALLESSLDVRVLPGPTGRASGLKLAFSGFSKGLVALFLDCMAAAEGEADRDELAGCLGDFYPGAVAGVERQLPTFPRHAARRVDELAERAAWLESRGEDTALSEAIGEIIARFARLGLDPGRAWDLPDIVRAWSDPAPGEGRMR